MPEPIHAGWTVNTGLHEHHHEVSPDEIDGQGHVNNLRYLAWMQDAAVAHSVAVGWDGSRYRSANLAWVVRRHSIEYQKPAFAGESIIVETWINDFKRIGCTRQYRMIRQSDRVVVAVAETLWVLTNRTTSIPVRLPKELASAFPLIDQIAYPRSKG